MGKLINESDLTPSISISIGSDYDSNTRITDRDDGSDSTTDIQDRDDGSDT